MPHKLKKPLRTIELDTVRIAAIKIEDNPAKGSKWIEIWLVIGKMNGDIFEQHAHPIIGTEEYKYIKLENGFHPLKSGSFLGRCEKCGEWTLTENVCSETSCGGNIKPYDGLERLEKMIMRDVCFLESIKEQLYYFLLKEMVPDPDTSKVIKLLDI